MVDHRLPVVKTNEQRSREPFAAFLHRTATRGSIYKAEFGRANGVSNLVGYGRRKNHHHFHSHETNTARNADLSASQ